MSKQSKARNLFTTSHRQAGISHLQESRAPSSLTIILEDQLLNTRWPSLPFSSPSFYCWAWCLMVCNMPLVSWGQLSQQCPLPAFCAPPACLLIGQREKQKRLRVVQALLSSNWNTDVLPTLFWS